MSKDQSFKIAAIQASPVYMDLDKTISKACALIKEAGAEGADLAVFPEAFVPGYPLWVWFIPPGHTHPLREAYTRLHQNSVSIPGPEVTRLADAAKKANVTVAIGVNENNSEASGSTLFNTLLYLGADGTILGKHRKMIPTAAERLVWGRSEGNDLEVFDLPFGKLSGLLCWENYMPLSRFFLSAKGEQIHVAPTWDRGDPWLSTLKHVAKESRCVVIGCCTAMRTDEIPDDFSFKEKYLADVGEWINPGDTVIVDPDGKIIAGPAQNEETILYATIESHQLIGPRWQLDVAGHYSRPDLFKLTVSQSQRPQLEIADLDVSESHG